MAFIGLYDILWAKVEHDDNHMNSRAERGNIFQGFLLTAYTFLNPNPNAANLKRWIPLIGLIVCGYTTFSRHFTPRHLRMLAGAF